MATFYHHPFELEREARLELLYRKMWFTGVGIFKYIYERLRLGKGAYPVDSILAQAGGGKRKTRQIERVLNDFDLFVIDNGMVSLKPGLSASDFIRKESNARKARKAAELRQKDYSDELFPEDTRAMDLEAAAMLDAQVAQHNKQELIEFL